MNLRGKLHSTTRDIRDGEFYVAFKVASISSEVDGLQDKDLDIEVKIHREKRSRNANAYYWELVGRIATYIGASRAFVHNMLLRDYGTLEVVGGENMTTWLPDDPETDILALESAEYHLAPTSYAKLIDGKMWRMYHHIKGSSRYDTAEMARLIDGAVSEAKSMDIETLPPDELERMMRAYEERNAK